MFDGKDLLTALGLVLLIEGGLYTLFPDALKRAMQLALTVPSGTLRAGGLATAAAGVGIVWLARG